MSDLRDWDTPFGPSQVPETCKENADSFTDDLAEAAEEYGDYHNDDCFDATGDRCPHIRKAFIAGAEWQKSQMMKEAVEGEVAPPQEDTRPSASERLDLLRARIRDAVKGYDPFRIRTRNAKAVAWRQCVYLLLKNEGYTLHAIADASGYNHATIAWGIKHAKDLVDIGDSEYKRIWSELNYIDEGWR